MQEGMLFHGLLDGSGTSYTTQIYYDLVGHIDIKAFKAAWRHIVSRHDILRTCFVGLGEEQIHQLVQSQVELPIVEEDWREMPQLVDNVNVVEHCIELASPPGLDSFLVNEKGYISFSTSGFQCFFDKDGPIADADAIFFAPNFCGAGLMILTSETTGTYDMSDGLVDGKRVVGGSGDTHGLVDHCTGNTTPYGNSGFSTFHGDIHTIVEE